MSSGVRSAFGRVSDNSTNVLITGLENIVWPILVIAFVLFSVLLPQSFFSGQNISFITYSASALGLLVLAEAVCLLSGNFDLSVGAVAGFSAMFTGLFMTSWFPRTPGVVGIVVILAVGSTIGLLNGISVGILGVNPFLQTLTFYIIFGQGIQVLSSLSISDLPNSYFYLGEGTLGPIPVAIFLLVGLFVVAWAALKYTRTGRAIYAVGGDEDASREAGIDTTRTVVFVYVLSGALAGLSGLVYTGYLGAVTPTLAQGALFPAFAAAVIGGISLFGGRGNILGALGGVLLLSTIQAGLVMLGIDPKLVKVINGIILLIAVLLYTGQERLRGRLLAE